MRLIDADKLIEAFEEQDDYLRGLQDKENPHKRAMQGQLNWCINMVHEQPTINGMKVGEVNDKSRSDQTSRKHEVAEGI